MKIPEEIVDEFGRVVFRRHKDGKVLIRRVNVFGDISYNLSNGVEYFYDYDLYGRLLSTRTICDGTK